MLWSTRLDCRLHSRILQRTSDTRDSVYSAQIDYMSGSVRLYRTTHTSTFSSLSLDTGLPTTRTVTPCLVRVRISRYVRATRGMREEILRNEYRLAPVWDPRNKEVE